MKRLLFSLLTSAIALGAYANEDNNMSVSENHSVSPTESIQSPSRNVFAEFFGPSFGIGVGFDSRFRQGSYFGYRVGLAFTDGSSDGGYDNYYRDIHFNGITIPLEVNAIFGNGKSKFEIGVGITPAILKRRDMKYIHPWNWDEDEQVIYKHGTKLNVIGTLNIGYRYQRESGFFMRIGLTGIIGDWDCSPVDGVWLLPNLSLGYTIKNW